jgi:putative transcription antitermination factor YqgF
LIGEKKESAWPSATVKQKIATPFKTVSGLSEIIEIIKTENIKKIIIGRPKKMSGENDVSDKYLSFFNKLNKKIGLDIIEIDERLTSLAADSLPGAKKTKAGRDEISAMLILQSYLDILN